MDQPLNPFFRRVPSQNGLFADPPQRHSKALCTRTTTRAVPAVISRLPRTLSGPSVCGSMASGPSHTASMSAWPVGGSPEASKCTSWCDPSQNGLFFEAAQRHAEALPLANQHDVAADGIGPGLLDDCEIHRRGGLFGPSVIAVVADRTKRTDFRNRHQLFGIHRVGMNPRSFDIGEEHRWRARHALPRMDASLRSRS